MLFLTHKAQNLKIATEPKRKQNALWIFEYINNAKFVIILYGLIF